MNSLPAEILLEIGKTSLATYVSMLAIPKFARKVTVGYRLDIMVGNGSGSGNENENYYDKFIGNKAIYMRRTRGPIALTIWRISRIALIEYPRISIEDTAVAMYEAYSDYSQLCCKGIYSNDRGARRINYRRFRLTNTGIVYYD